MAVTVVLNGTSYSIPEPGNDAWGQDLTDYFVAQASGLLQKAGGTFTLTAEVDFGATYGLKSVYFKSRAASPATAGVLRLGNAELISWRNAANDANLSLTVNSSNLLAFNGTAIQPAGNYISALTGDVTATGPGSVAATLSATSNATLTDLSALTSAANLATVGTITTGVWNGTTIAIANGGTGQTTANDALNALLPDQTGESGKVLSTDGSDTSWIAPLTNPMTTAGDIIYGGASGAANRLAGNTTAVKQYLSQTGNGVASATPAWAQVAFADLSGSATVAQGGTGQTSLTANNVLLGNGTSAVQFVAPGTSGNVLTSNGTTWASAAIPRAYFSGYNDASRSWARTNTALGDPAAAAAASLQTVQSSGLGTVTQYDSGGGSWLPGLTFTPATSGRYKITAFVNTEAAISGAFGQVQFYNVTAGAAVPPGASFRAAAVNMSSTVALQTVLNLTAATPQTITIRTAATSGAVTVVNQGVLDGPIQWAIEYLGP